MGGGRAGTRFCYMYIAYSKISKFTAVNPLTRRALVIVLILVIFLLAGAWLYAARVPVRPQTIDLRGLEGLPALVRRYFRVVFEEGQPMVAGAPLGNE